MDDKRVQLRQVQMSPTDFEVREDGDKKTVSGYFAVFNSDYRISDTMSESVAPDAFDNTLGNDIRCLVNHDTSKVLGRTKNGTLTLKVDSHGLYGTVEINEEDQDAMNLYAKVKRGDVSGCSMGFYINKEDYEDRGKGESHWTIRDIDLFEVSCCTFPAYEQTQISARERDLQDIQKRENQKFKQDMLEKIHGGK